MDKYRGISIGPTVGTGRGKDKHKHPGPQAEAEDDEDDRAPQRNAIHEEVASRANSCADT
jgi:hypothetical protein